MTDELVDEEVTCKDCGVQFIHPVGEQQWMREKWGEDYKKPMRCRDCRRKRRNTNRERQAYE